MKIEPIEGARGACLITLEFHQDERGNFTEFYHSHTFRKHGIKGIFAQWNQSTSARGVIRGMHFQEPAQAKLIRVVSGSIRDVIVDMRRRPEECYGKRFHLDMHAKDNVILYIPKGFAHGFQALEPDTVVTYGVTALYNHDGQYGFHWNDPLIADLWTIRSPIVSLKDIRLPYFEDSQKIKLRPAPALSAP